MKSANVVVFAVLAVELCRADSDEVFEVIDGVKYRRIGDMLLPLATPGERGAYTLGSTVVGGTNLWAGGKMNYYIETVKTHADRPADAPLAADDARISSAIAEWEAKTCIRFTKCNNEASCTQPYLRFISDASSCLSPLGVSNTGVNQISLASGCGKGATIHEIGHSLGLSHEHNRKDRNEFVAIDTSAISTGKADQFSQNTGSARDVGPYDYGSIMHYSAYAFANATIGKPTIVSPELIGQRTRLSDGDVSAIQFMYGGCSATFAQPLCVVSQTAVTHVIPHSKDFTIEVNALYSSSLTVSFATATIPVTYDNGPGSVGSEARVVATLQPTSADAGKTTAVSVSFTASDGKAVTCTTDISVASSSNVCFGISSDDSSVCGGRGTCGSDPLAPCTCNTGFGGLECKGFATCPANYLYSFDEDVGTWAVSGTGSLDATFGAQDASLKIVSTDTATSGAVLQLQGNTMPKRMTFYGARASGKNFQYRLESGGVTCVSGRFDTRLYLDGEWTRPLASDTFVFVDLRIDAAASKLDAYYDGQLYHSQQGFSASCSNGFDKIVFVGSGWVDEFRMLCTDYVAVSGSLLNLDSQLPLKSSSNLQLTYTLVGEDTWVDTAANKQAVLAALSADVTQATGWDGLKSTLLSVGKISFGGATLTIGPLNAASTYSSWQSETVSLTLAATMFASGKLPASQAQELSFMIPGLCPGGMSYAMDTVAQVNKYIKPANGAVSTAVKKTGAGSLEFTNQFTNFLSAGVNHESVRPSSIKFYARVDAFNGLLVAFGGDRSLSTSITLQHGISQGRITWHTSAASSPTASAVGVVTVATFDLVDLTFNWAAGTYSVSLNSATQGGGAIPANMHGVYTMRFVATTQPAYIDELIVQCDAPAPTTNSPPTPAPATPAPPASTPAPATSVPTTLSPGTSQAPPTPAPPTLEPTSAPTGIPATPSPPGQQTPSPPDSSLTPTPPGPTSCSSAMIAAQSECLVHTTSTLCAQHAGCRFCPSGAGTFSCLYTGEVCLVSHLHHTFKYPPLQACGKLTVGIIVLDYNVVGTCPSPPNDLSGAASVLPSSSTTFAAVAAVLFLVVL